MKGEYGAAAKDFQSASERNPTAVFTRLWLAASYAQAGRLDDAAWQIDEIKVLGPLPTVREAVKRNSILRHLPYIELYAAGLRKAGLPK